MKYSNGMNVSRASYNVDTCGKTRDDAAAWRPALHHLERAVARWNHDKLPCAMADFRNRPVNRGAFARRHFNGVAAGLRHQDVERQTHLRALATVAE